MAGDRNVYSAFNLMAISDGQFGLNI